MILIFAKDDADILEDAYKKKYAKFGIPYCYSNKFGSMSWTMKKDENIYITAHGNQDEIGNMNDSYGVTAKKLASILKQHIIPSHYTGSIYISACNSAPEYVNELLIHMGGTYSGRIYGCKGKIDIPLQPPKNNSWIMAI